MVRTKGKENGRLAEKGKMRLNIGGRVDDTADGIFRGPRKSF